MTSRSGSKLDNPQDVMTANFDGVAPYYSALEWIGFGNAMQDCRVAFLHEIGPCRRVLVPGEGVGTFLRAFRETNPSAEVHVIDASIGMLRRAEKSVRATDAHPNGPQTFFHHADILKWENPSGDGFDLVATHFFLDCFEPSTLDRVVQHIAAMTRRNARWLISDFQHPATRWKAWRARLWIRALYLFFRATTGLKARHLTSPTPLLERAGFELVNRRESCDDMLYSDLRRRHEGCA